MSITPVTTESSNRAARAIVAQYFRIWNDGDPATLLDILSVDWVDHAHPERDSPQAVVSAFEAARRDHPETRVSIDAVLGDEPLITVNGRISTGEKTENKVWLVRVADGLLHELWTYAA